MTNRKPWDGYPPNSETDGWHWLVQTFSSGQKGDACYYWFSGAKKWSTWHSTMTPQELIQAVSNIGYSGPVMTPAQVKAERDAAVLAMRDAAEAAVDTTETGYLGVGWDEGGEALSNASDAIRALPLPGDVP